MSSKTIRYIGHYDVLARGKFLLEILGQLRNFGVGRLVSKSEWQRRWPDEPSFVRVLQVQARMDRWLRHGRVLGEWTVRGHNLGVYEFGRALDRADWLLIHRQDEPKWTQFEPAADALQLRRPQRVPMPPLHQVLAKEYADTSPTHVHNRPVLDREHMYLADRLQLDAACNASTSSIYDVDPALYTQQLYGAQWPLRVDKYDAIDRTAVAGDKQLDRPQDVDQPAQPVAFIN